ncbi:MAG: hypothetical protein V7K69_14395 [Nostoc sp.]|uniref:hypothetical protein n=1 Tax=Nostoc sp. TaxID=1180 RepID=UPI002FF48B9D
MPTVSRQYQVLPHPLTTSAIAESPADVGYWSYEWRVGGKSGTKSQKLYEKMRISGSNSKLAAGFALFSYT